MKKILVMLMLSFGLASCGTQTSETSTQDNTLSSHLQQHMTEQLSPLKEGDIVATMKTSNGTFTIKLFVNEVPKTALNFIGLAQKGYYDGITFHRVIPGFMIQGGDPEGTGRGGESYYGANFEDEFHPELKNIAGSLSMANAGPNTNGSQFFINQVDNNFLDNKHSVFGQVVKGTENIDTIAKTKTDSNDKPEKDIKIISIQIGEYNGAKVVDTQIDVEAKIAEVEILKEEEAKQKAESDKDRAVKKGDIIAVHYTGTFEDGEKFDSSLDRGTPLEFQVGAGQMIPGFDAGVVRMKLSEKKKLTLEAKDAYGEYDENNTQDFPRDQMASFEAAGIEIKVGAELPTQAGVFKIKALSDDTVTIDTNHPLAGKTLLFEVEIVEFKN
ncbi:peptidylprolyl isomerase [Candidatus Gracilibacteria bacterium]|nr:peptidylprolyl isomerase [Candidatus Gracilibacteria bacterium]